MGEMGHSIFLAFVFFIGFIFGGVSYFLQDIDKNYNITEFQTVARGLKAECEKNLARSKECIIDFKFVIEKEKKE